MSGPRIGLVPQDGALFSTMTVREQLAFALVVAIPYIPGSGSSAFKGMSLFIGVLVSIGSGGAVANIISGVILIYMRPYAIGDRVQIGESVGDVVDRNLLTTRIRTPKNERVTIPNTNILTGQIINYTSKARKKELILHTSVTIGYDVPQEKVRELLIAAAQATESIEREPEPFVLITSLDDFYVSYELNVYTEDPNQPGLGRSNPNWACFRRACRPMVRLTSS